MICQPQTCPAVIAPAVGLIRDRLAGPLPGDDTASAAKLGKLILQSVDLFAQMAGLLPTQGGVLCASPADVSLASMIHVAEDRQSQLATLLRRFALENHSAVSSCSMGLFVWSIVPAADGATLRSPIADGDLCIVAHHFFGSLACQYRVPNLLEELLVQSRLTSLDLTRLLLVWFLGQPLSVSLHPSLLEHLPEIFRFLVNMDCSMADALWGLVAAECTSSCNAPGALALALVASSPDLNARDWSVLVDRLQSVTALISICGPDRGPVSVQRMLTTLSFEDTVAEALLALKLTPAELMSGSSTSPAGVALVVMRTYAPITSASDTLAIRCAWLTLQKWDSVIKSTCLLELAVDFVWAISHSRARHGLALAMWMQFLRLRMGEAVALVEKVGKCPKERLCQKHLELAAPEISIVCRMSRLLFEIISQPAVDAAQPPLADECWTNPTGRVAECTADARMQELRAALASGPASSELAREHANLCAVVELVFSLDLKSVHPLSLFQPAARARFFSPLVSLGDDHDQGDVQVEDLSAVRAAFLSGALAALVQTNSSLTNVLFSLAANFDIKADSLRLQHVCNLHERGYAIDDSLCHVSSHDGVGALLMEVERRRLWAFVQAQPMKERMDLIAHMPVHLHDWLSATPPKSPSQCDVAVLDAQTAMTALRRVMALVRPSTAEAGRLGELMTVLESISRTRA